MLWGSSYQFFESMVVVTQKPVGAVCMVGWRIISGLSCGIIDQDWNMD